jgi:hypothetical protein
MYVDMSTKQLVPLTASQEVGRNFIHMYVNKRKFTHSHFFYAVCKCMYRSIGVRTSYVYIRMYMYIYMYIYFTYVYIFM